MDDLDPGIVIRAAVRHERAAAAGLLAHAFEHDPLIATACEGTRDPLAARTVLFRATIAGTLQAGGELALATRNGTLIGAALVADPSHGTFARAVRAALARWVSAARFLAIAPHLAPNALRQLNDADVASRRLAPHHAHHVLVAVGVTESARGVGAGRRLVEHAVDRARHDARSWGVRLETENPGNVDRYARWGFTTLGVAPMQRFDVHVMAKASGPPGQSEEKN